MTDTMSDMPRQSRIDTPGALHHIITRGIERRKIFIDDQDRYDFINRLGKILEQTGTECFAWALMPNHLHLLLRTGSDPIATVMRRLLTGHAVRYNRRHHRHGQLFQNRYKSILCQQDTYLLDLVRYIHLNPMRAKLVQDMNALGKYPFSGHGIILGKHRRSWQNIDAVLGHFGKQMGPARRMYRVFVAKGIEQGKRSDLTGGGLVRSAGGWTTVKILKKSRIHIKSDERILGDGEFVEKILSKCKETFERRYALKTQGVDVDYVAERVAQLLGMESQQVWLAGKYKQQVTARSLLCYWAVRELGLTMTSMARRLNISTPAVSKSVVRGAEIADKEGYTLI